MIQTKRQIPFFDIVLILAVETVIKEKSQEAAEGQRNAKRKSNQTLRSETNYRIAESEDDPNAIKSKVALLALLIGEFEAEGKNDFKNRKGGEKKKRDAAAIGKNGSPSLQAIGEKGEVSFIDIINRGEKKSQNKSNQKEGEDDFKIFLLHQ